MTFIVAEIGVNWDGDFELVEKMIRNSKKAGCDAVKFQAFTENMVINHPEKQRLMKSTISKNNIEKIHEISKSVGIEWFCTPMYLEAVELLDPYVKRFKIREFDGRSLLENKFTKLLTKILEKEKQMIVSVTRSPKNTKYYRHEKINWLYCVPKYPCSLYEIDFTKLNEFDGYSNHCIEQIAPLSACILGAKIIEIHVTQDRSYNYVDNNVSLNFSELIELVRQIRLAEKIKR